jgi:hypothetical protein
MSEAPLKPAAGTNNSEPPSIFLYRQTGIRDLGRTLAIHPSGESMSVFRDPFCRLFEGTYASHT